MRSAIALILALCACFFFRMEAADLITGLGSPSQAVLGGQGISGSPDFGEFLLPRNDDQFSAAIDITSVFPNGLNFGGRVWNSLFVTNNGCLTFREGSSTFTPAQIQAGATLPRIAAFFADVDTRGGIVNPSSGGTSKGTNMVYWDLDATSGIFTATWDDVGYFSSQTNRLCAFQIRLIRISDDGDFTIEYRYEDMNWTTGAASGGSGGLGGIIARAGYTAANSSDFFEMPQSGNQDQMLALETLSNQSPAVPGLFTFSIARPRPVISPLADTFTNASPIPFTFLWNVPVAGFTTGDISVTNGTVSGFAEVTAGRSFTVMVTPTADGPVTLTIPAAAVTSTGSGNTNPAISHTVTSDRTPPTMTLTPTGTTVYTATVPFTATVSEPLIGFVTGDVVASNGTVSRFAASGANYSISIRTSQDGGLTITVPQAAVTDRAGNTLTADATATVTVSTLGPIPTITANPAGPVNGDVITFTFAFPRAVTGFAANDIAVTNGQMVAGSFTVVSASVYTVQVTPSGTGFVSVRINDGAGVDGNNLPSVVAGASVMNDITAPTVTITMPTATLAGAGVAYLEFSEAVTGITIAASGDGTAGAPALQTGSLTRFSVPVSATATGTLTLTVSAATDLAGNDLAGPVAASVVTDVNTLAPLVITTSAGTRTAAALIPVTFTFTADATEFIATDVTVSNGSRGDLTAAGGGRYTMPVNASNNGPVIIRVAQAACQVGGVNNGAAQLIVIFDQQAAAPVITLDPRSGSPGMVMTVTLTYPEPMSGLTADDLGITGGTASNFASSASGTVFTFTVTCDPRPSYEATLAITAGQYQDGLGNQNAAVSATLYRGRGGSSGNGFFDTSSSGCGFGIGVFLLLIACLPLSARRRLRG